MAAGGKVALRTVSFFHTHTGERLEATYCCNGRYEPEAPSRLDLLHELGGTLETDAPFQIIAGVNP